MEDGEGHKDITKSPDSPGASPKTVVFASMLAGARELQIMGDSLEARNWTSMWNKKQRALEEKQTRIQGPTQVMLAAHLEARGLYEPQEASHARNRGASFSSRGASFSGETCIVHEYNRNEAVNVFLDRELRDALGAEDIHDAEAHPT